MTVKQSLVEATKRLAAAACTSPRVDAERLVEHALALRRSELYSSPEKVLSGAERTALEDSVARRCQREPLAYILGEWGFRRLTLQVTSDVLVPRPETELVVERCLIHLRGLVTPRVLEIGTGSGAIALAIADEQDGAHVTATDISEAALEVAAGNARAVGLAERVDFVHGDLYAGQAGPFDLVVSNPPYVSTDEYAELEPEVARFEPRVALVGSAFHERIARGASAVLAPEGWLVLETAENQAAGVARILGSGGWAGVRVEHDLSDRPRIVEAQHDRPAAASRAGSQRASRRGVS